MRLNKQKPPSRIRFLARGTVGLAVALARFGSVAVAQNPDATAGPQIYETIYLTNLTQENDANELMNDLRNMLSKAKLYYVASQGAMSIRGTAEEIALARKILSDLDKTKKIYRLTYTMTEKDGGKTIGLQHFSIIVASGSKTDFKQGSRVPIEVGGKNSSSGSSSPEVTYLDVGQEIDASLDGYLDGVRLRSKVVQSSIVEDKSGAGSLAPVIRQTTLEGTSTLIQGKPLVLGSLDIPGSTRQQEVEVVSELVR